jgi:universal stress protein E
VRAARRFGADLIVAEVHKGRRLAPWLVHLTDWELLRTSSIPVLLLTSIKSWNRAPVLAAVDPSHTNSEASGLDAEVVAHAGTLAAATRSALHIMHSTFTSIAGLTAGDPVIDGSLIATYLDRKEEEDRDEFGTFARRASISAARRHLVTGNPIEEIPKVARALRAGVVVMGAVSRSGLRRVFIGNTAERVLNALPCDVLVVKPPGFATRVAGKSRGIRVVPPQPLMPMPM